ncbi:glycine zipper 2TM domain-containing protein [Paucibacter sp. APW11]|uniref:Glycine zipper 2TM domain-containing protein n=1 Tax=Roseateles aquae TaxID=3077235 RepID=A0ABU3PDA3_9BURK|nr:glycine zipper 2TM domain-containing protein [Paucibacter sp. APW11]MDT9000103.1 glycine zipper 2TM domain-containing protein [Paucibacter sp. APW11]
MRFPLSASQSLAAGLAVVVIVGGAYALGRAQSGGALPMSDSQAASLPASAAQSSAKKAAAPAFKASGDARLCDECARVVEVRQEERKGKASGLGAVGGAVIGGLLGNQIGGGTGKKLATVGGAVAGGYAGNEMEKRSKSHHVWIVRLSHTDGSTQTLEREHDPQLRVGDVVLVRDGQLQRQP